MTKKTESKTRKVIRIGKGDLDVGGILKNGKAGQELRKAVVSKLKKARGSAEPKSNITLYDVLLKSGAIVEKDEPIESDNTPDPVGDTPAN